jgi:hypothetical protein
MCCGMVTVAGFNMRESEGSAGEEGIRGPRKSDT